jgi:T5SS/PEP-CTERM-associated repeat protein/autotransporter-associated beta strand protein
VGGLTFDGGALRTTGSFTTTRATTLNNGGGTFETATGTTLTHNGPMSGVGGLTKSSAGTLAMGGINTYTGPTTINAGVLRLTGVERLADATDVTVAAGATLDLNNFNETFDSLSGAGSVALGTAQLVVGLNNGTGSFSGVISGTGDLLKEGTGVQTLSGLNTYSGATFVDRGELILNGGGRIDQSTTIVGFNIGSNGTATADGAGTTWDLSGNLLVGLDGTARMNIRNGAVMTVEGDVTIGSNNQGPGSMGTLSLAGGTLNNLAGNGVDVVNGVLQGHGSILGNVDNFSRVAPGNSAGILNVSGNFVQGTGATLAFELGGRDNSNPQDPQFDVLDVAGNLGLDGVLELSLLGGFTPLASDTFTVVESGFLAGTFTNVANGARLDLAGGGTGSFQVNYGAGSPFGANLVVLSSFEGSGSLLGDFDGNGLYECPDVDALVAVIAAGSNNLTFDMNGDGFVNDDDLTEWLAVAGEANLPSGNSYLYGDATLDGAVDGLDFITWNANKFQPIAAWCSADFTADGFVDGQDLVIWNMNKFQSAGMLDGGGGGSVGAGWFGAESSPVSGSAMVPEPTSLWLIAVALWSAAIHRRFASKRD